MRLPAFSADFLLMPLYIGFQPFDPDSQILVAPHDPQSGSVSSMASVFRFLSSHSAPRRRHQYRANKAGAAAQMAASKRSV
jgi:hypothetical protein